MPMCSIKPCGARRAKNCPGLTLHRFPTNESLKRKWVDAIGGENINLRHKILWVCSKHFEKSKFNRTLDVVRLRENAVPSLFIETSNSPTRSVSPDVTQDVACTERSNSPTRSNSPDVTQNVACTEMSNSITSAVSIEKDNDQKLRVFGGTSSQPLNMTHAEIQKNMNRLKQLTEICKNQRIKIKRLNEKVRKRNVKIAVLQDIIEHLNVINPNWEQVRVKGRSLVIYQKSEESGADAS